LAKKFVSDTVSAQTLNQGITDSLKARLSEAVAKEKFDETSPSFRNATKRTHQYLMAYFGSVTLAPETTAQIDEVQRAALQAKLASTLKRKPDDPLVVGIVGDSLGILQGISLKTSTSGFVAREGTVFGFPGVTQAMSGNSIDHSQIGADVIRIILDALRDAYAPLPVLAESTAGRLAGDSNEGLPIDIASPGDIDGKRGVVGTWHFAGSASSQAFPYGLAAGDFALIEANARSAEASVAGAVGKAIRGGSWGSLNNESLAKFIETAAGVLARQTVERSEWCARYSKSEPQPN
jgi:hypothetical protein